MPTALYHLGSDAAEQRNLLQSEEQRVEEMHNALNEQTGYEKNKAQ
jgi:hypothetical protein